MSVASLRPRWSSTRLPLLAAIGLAILLIPAGLARASGPNGVLQGYITDSSTAVAVAGANVQVTASDVNWVFQATTDAAGFFAITLPNHAYSLQVSAAAYDINSTSVIVGSAETVWNNMSLVAASPRTAVLQGYVKDGSTSAAITVGRVVATTVWWSSEDYTNSSSMDATGFYRIAILPGTYQVSTSGVAGYAPYTSTYLYPSNGVVLWWNISLSARPLVAWINGTVVDASTYATIAGANLTASMASAPLGQAQSNATGRFSLNVPQGTATITADAAGHAPATASFTVYSGTTTTVLYLTPLSASERGWIRDGLTRAPIPGATFTATPFWSTGYTDQATTNAVGYFQLSLTADDFDLAAKAPGYTSWAGYDFLSAGDVIWNNITLWPITSPVQGFVLDGATGAHLSGIYVYAYDARSGYSAWAVSNAAGFYAMVLPPSPATILRVYGSPPYTGLYAYPDVRPYVTTWANLTLSRLNADVQVTVINGSSGLPISPAYVNAYWTNGYNYGITDGTGFTDIAVPAGVSITLYLSATGYLALSVPVGAFSGVTSITVALNPSLPLNVTVQGYVLSSATLLPVTSAFVQASGYNGSTPYGYTDSTGYYTFTMVDQPQTLQATAWRFSRGTAIVSPMNAATLWVNFTLTPDATGPLILNFTATPENNVGPANPTDLAATVNESSLASASLSIYKMWSSAAGVGTFLAVGQVASGNISVSPTTAGNSSVSSRYDTRTQLATLSDGTASHWWPATSYWYPHQAILGGTFENATLTTPTYASALFDTENGRLLYVIVNNEYVDPTDQPTATFTPSASAYQLSLYTAALVGYSTVTGPTFTIGTLTLSLSNALSSGQYAAYLQAIDAGSNYGNAQALFNVTADTTPPVARAGPNQSVNQGSNVTLDGSASSDNIAITGYTWTFTDGTAVVLHGAVVHHVFPNAGVYHVTLTVYDAAGNTGTASLTVTVLDTTPPAVTITAPSAGARLVDTVTVTASATDNVGVARVEFLVDGVAVGSATSAPYGVSLDTTKLANGNHTLEAIAYDAAGNNATATERVDVQNAVPPGGLGSPLGLDPLVWILLVVVLVAGVGAVVALLIVKRRRRTASSAVRSAPPTPPTDGSGP